MKKDEKAGLFKALKWFVWIAVILMVAPFLFMCAAYIIGSMTLSQ